MTSSAGSEDGEEWQELRDIDIHVPPVEAWQVLLGRNEGRDDIHRLIAVEVEQKDFQVREAWDRIGVCLEGREDLPGFQPAVVIMAADPERL